MRRYGMAVSPLAVVAGALAAGGLRDAGLGALAALAAVWLVLEVVIAVRQEYHAEVPGGAWVMASRVGWLGALVLAFVEVHAPVTARIVPDALRWGALALFGLGVLIRWAAWRELGRQFTYDVRVAAGQRLVTTGPYAVVRHPAYLAICLLGTVPGLVAGSALGFLLLAVTTIPQTVYRLRVEERLLARTFGADWERYRGRTARLVPFVY